MTPNIDLLTDEEREYLTSVIRPFYTKVLYISVHDCVTDNQYLEIITSEEYGEHTLEFPEYPTRKYYKNLEIDYKYTLCELGIAHLRQ